MLEQSVIWLAEMNPEMTREEIEQRMDELARTYVETHNPEIPQELYRLARELEKIEKLEKQ
jgi:hypothetical protein